MDGTGNLGEQAALAALQDELVFADATIDAAVPMLRHLLTNDDKSLFSEEIVARVRGMEASLARQLLFALADAAGEEDPDGFAGLHDHDIEQALRQQAALLSHLHAIALEWQLSERLQTRDSLDPVLSPLVQSLVASSEPSTASAAMGFVASQARFVQQQRRMELPLKELPGDLFHIALLAMRPHSAGLPEDVVKKAEEVLRGGFDEATTRLGLMSRLVTGMAGGSIAALSISHAGTAIYLTALAEISGQNRIMTILSASQSHHLRHALALRAAGLKPANIRDQLERMCGEALLAPEFDLLSPERAGALLSGLPAGASRLER